MVFQLWSLQFLGPAPTGKQGWSRPSGFRDTAHGGSHFGTLCYIPVGVATRSLLVPTTFISCSVSRSLYVKEPTVSLVD